MTRAQDWQPIAEPRYVVAKASGSRYAYVIDSHGGGTVKRYDILKGHDRANGWECAKRHAERLNSSGAAPVEGES